MSRPSSKKALSLEGAADWEDVSVSLTRESKERLRSFKKEVRRIFWAVGSAAAMS